MIDHDAEAMHTTVSRGADPLGLPPRLTSLIGDPDAAVPLADMYKEVCGSGRKVTNTPADLEWFR